MYTTKRKRIEQKRKLVEMLGGECEHCGYCKNLAALDFHHPNPEEKEDDIGTLINFHKFSDAKREAEKCVLLCKNCHQEEHHSILEISVQDNKVSMVNQELNEIQKECLECKKYCGGQKYCSDACSKISQRRVKRPSRAELKKLIEESSWTALGRKFGVSDNAVRKWAKGYDLI